MNRYHIFFFVQIWTDNILYFSIIFTENFFFFHRSSSRNKRHKLHIRITRVKLGTEKKKTLNRINCAVSCKCDRMRWDKTCIHTIIIVGKRSRILLGRPSVKTITRTSWSKLKAIYKITYRYVHFRSTSYVQWWRDFLDYIYERTFCRTLRIWTALRRRIRTSDGDSNVVCVCIYDHSYLDSRAGYPCRRI